MVPPDARPPAPPAATEQARPPDLDARYGRTRMSRTRIRVIVALVAAAFATVVVAWLVWGGLGGAPAQFEAVDTRHSVIDDRSVMVSWTFTVQPGTPARCALQATNRAFSIVGWTIVDLPPSPERTREFTEVVRTTEQAQTGLIYRCWLT